MTNRATGIVEAITSTRTGMQEILVRLQTLSEGEPADASARPAMNLTELNGDVEVGDTVQVNTIAIDLTLGTGGFDFVIAILNRAKSGSEPPGHIIKLRYTPLQTPVVALESPESPYHEAVKGFTSLAEIPVVCCELHSQLPAVCAALKWALTECGKSARVVYIMTDGAALPMALSRLIPSMMERGLISACITAGQAFGGNYEAVNIYSGMAAAYSALEADAIVIGQGPGNVGTSTKFGFSGIDQGMAVNAAASLGGVPIFVPRISFSDERVRHIGLSHHSITNLTSVVRSPCLLPIPRLARSELNRLYAVLQQIGIMEAHEVITVDADKGLKALEDCGVAVTTMGRGLSKERAFFLAASAAGLLAAQLVEVRG